MSYEEPDKSLGRAAYRRNSCRRKCAASGDDYYAYSVSSHPGADGRAACPQCGKMLKLVVKLMTGRRRYTVPAHNKLGDAT